MELSTNELFILANDRLKDIEEMANHSVYKIGLISEYQKKERFKKLELIISELKKSLNIKVDLFEE